MKNTTTLTIESSQVIRLMQAHLTECGLHESCRVLRQESGIGGAGALGSHANLLHACKTGQWGSVLDTLSGMDATYISNKTDLLANVHEQAILELGHLGQVELAYAALRLAQDVLDDDWQSRTQNMDTSNTIPPSREMEQKLAALVAQGENRSIPPDYYGKNVTQQDRRNEIAQQLHECIPLVPHSRLTTLLQQALKWQAHTGQVPYVKQHWEEEENNENKKRKRKRKEFDLVLGEVSRDATSTVGDDDHREDSKGESVPSSVYSVLKFGKKATVESALFLPDGSGLVTGSSDGLVEIWDPSHRYSKLRMDLAFQEREEFLYHDNAAILAMAVSTDATMLATGDDQGGIKVWRVDTTGQCLREFAHAHEKTISCLAFSNDASRVLSASHDFTCREYGLRTSRMLKEFRGHTSYVNSCHYVLMSDHEETAPRVVTGSADGTVRIWDGKTSEVLHMLLPTKATMGASMLVSQNQTTAAGVAVSNIHTVLPLHNPPNTLLVVPRAPRAYLVSMSNSAVMRIYEDQAGNQDYVVGMTSPSNHWFYGITQSGACHVYQVSTGKLMHTLRNFAEQSMGSPRSGGEENAAIEISGLIHHPHKGIVGGFSNDKSQKRGLLTLWK